LSADIAAMAPGDPSMSAWGLPRAESPEQIGLPSERLASASEVICQDVEQRLIPEAVFAIARAGRVAYAKLPSPFACTVRL